MVLSLRLCAESFVPDLVDNALAEAIERLTPVACFPFDCCANPLRERPSFCESHGSEHHVRGEGVLGRIRSFWEVGGANAGTVNALGVVAHDRGYIDTGLSYATILAICSGN